MDRGRQVRLRIAGRILAKVGFDDREAKVALRTDKGRGLVQVLMGIVRPGEKVAISSEAEVRARLMRMHPHADPAQLLTSPQKTTEAKLEALILEKAGVKVAGWTKTVAAPPWKGK